MTKKTVTVASKAHSAVRIHNADTTAVINGNRHADAVGDVGLTHDVDPDLINGWLEANPDHKDVLSVVSDEDVAKMKSPAGQYGFEPGLAKLAEDPDNKEAAQEGSKAPTPVKAKDMAATSSVPNDDSPRSQTTT